MHQSMTHSHGAKIFMNRELLEEGYHYGSQRYGGQEIEKIEIWDGMGGKLTEQHNQRNPHRCCEDGNFLAEWELRKNRKKKRLAGDSLIHLLHPLPRLHLDQLDSFRMMVRPNSLGSIKFPLWHCRGKIRRRNGW
jgi:hypothetical protein